MAPGSYHPNGGYGCSIGYEGFTFLGSAATRDRNIVPQWTSSGVLVVLILALLGFLVARPYLTFDTHLFITSVLILISATTVCPIETTGRVVRPRPPTWISAALALCSADGTTVASLQPTFDRIGITQASAQAVTAGWWWDCSP